jgi:hypothetical protein
MRTKQTARYSGPPRGGGLLASGSERPSNAGVESSGGQMQQQPETSQASSTAAERTTRTKQTGRYSGPPRGGGLLASGSVRPSNAGVESSGGQMQQQPEISNASSSTSQRTKQTARYSGPPRGGGGVGWHPYLRPSNEGVKNSDSQMQQQPDTLNNSSSTSRQTKQTARYSGPPRGGGLLASGSVRPSNVGVESSDNQIQQLPGTLNDSSSTSRRTKQTARYSGPPRGGGDIGWHSALRPYDEAIESSDSQMQQQPGTLNTSSFTSRRTKQTARYSGPPRGGASFLQ